MLQSRLAKVGFAKQTAKGSAATEATYDIGVLGGTVASAELTEEDLNPTADSRVLSYVERKLVVPGAAFDAVGMPKSIGMLLLAACGAVATTGAAAPFTHTITTADDLPYVTLFGRYAAQRIKVTDAKLDELEIEFDGSGAIKVKAKFVGIDQEFIGSYTVAAGGDERPVDSPPLISAGGVFTVDGAAAVIKKGSIKISNKVKAVDQAATTTPYDVSPGMQEITVSLTVVPEDLTLYRTVLTGSPAGTEIAGDVYIGDISLKFVRGADTDLTFAAGACALATEFPEANPEGGPAEIPIEAKVLAPASGNPFTFVLRNTVASY